LLFCASAADQPDKSIRPTQQVFAGAPPLAAAPRAFNPSALFAIPSRIRTKHDETSYRHDELNIWHALVIGD
jgi:hypothetical protein